VFFNRFGKTSVTKCPSKSPEPAASPAPTRPGRAGRRGTSRVSRQRWALLGIAAAIAAPTSAIHLAHLYADGLPGSESAPDGRPNGAAPATQPSGSAVPATQPSSAAVSQSATAAPDPTAVAITPAPAPVDTLTAKQHYQRARTEYLNHNWSAARKDFEAARAGNYRPGLFEGDSPSTYLARMDRKERDDARMRPVALQTTGEASPAGPTTGDSQVQRDLQGAAVDESLKNQESAYEAQQLVKEGQAAQQSGDLQGALDKYQVAHDLDSSNAQATAGLNEVETALGKNPNPPDMLTQREKYVTAARQAVQYNFGQAINDAQQDISANKYDQAQTALNRAQIAATSNPDIFKRDELQHFTDQINATQVQLNQSRAAFAEHQQQLSTQQQEAALRDQRTEQQKEQQALIYSLKQEAIRLTEAHQYRQALAIVEQILTLDPNNEYAIGVRPLLEDDYQYAVQRGYTEQRDFQITEQLNAAEEKMIPYSDILKYPEDWPEISQTRDQTVASERGEDKESRAVEAQLDRPLPELSFDGVGFSDVVEFLRDVSGANIFVNWRALDTAGIDRNAPVTAKLRNVKFSKALQVILDSLSTGTTKVGYTVDDGVITISAGDDLSKNTILRVYDIRDLIISIPDFTDAPDFSLNSTSNNGAQNPSGGSGSGPQVGGTTNNIFGGGTGAAGGTSETQTRQDLVDQIVKLITSTIAPDSWRDAGGSVGSITELSGQLIVTQTPENQRALVGLLEQLRETRAIQVTVETRFLTVSRNFLDDVGVDLNFIFNQNGNISKNFGSTDSAGAFTNAIPLSAATSAFTSGPTTPVSGSLGATVSSPGLSTAVTYLDDFQVNLLLHATEASQNSVLVTAPRVTLFNGQRAYVLVATQQAYVSNLTASVGTGVSSFTPTISVVESGVELDVQATVSADRKYVTLTLRPQLSTLIGLPSFGFQSGGTSNGSTTVGGTVYGGSTPSGVIQIPEIQITEVKTTVSVPDGGTLLLGGQTIAGEISKEQGVPVLSDIPFLKRLFTNRSSAKDEEVLLILVRPTILIEKEIEQKEFPTLTSKLGS
jgi:type II secretory pathway component GspD/PulD (secretin)/tetratricopeptide (TPR) repeat protein